MLVKEKNKEYEELKAQSPSLLGSIMLMLIYRYGGLFLAPVAVFIGISIIISSTLGDMIIRFVAKNPGALSHPEANRLISILGLVIILVGILLFVVSRLAKKIMKRNFYIIEMQEVMDKKFDDA